jgi:NAD(P)-dependent dehydrogenase (short-subunit alcohol dehydrogenase family)
MGKLDGKVALITVGNSGISLASVYATTKAAVRAFARTWTTDLKASRIRVNAILS